MSTRREKIGEFFQEFRDRLSYQDALPQLVTLGVVSGIAASLLIVGFRWLLETPLLLAFDGQADGFESLPPLGRFLLPFLGALVLGAALSFVSKEYHSVSVSHVLERLHNHQGKLPGRNLLVQFFGGMVALATGQSVGREGPAIHLGAGLASQLGQYFRLPNNSLRTLVACGSAAGISASFNTPMAGVIFAMEVLLREYTVAGFLPVIIASVLGATLSQLVFGADINFVMTAADNNVLWQLPYLVFVGVVFSLAAAAFIRLHLAFFDLQGHRIGLRFLAIGLVTGTVAVFVPQIMGTGYDTLNSAMVGQLGLQLLLLIVVAKLLVTAMATGLGMVGGLIGPTLVIGGCLGGLLGLLGNSLVPGAANTDFYVVLGMVSMMGAVLNAPLAALVAILELSHSPGMIFPSMLAVVVACFGVQQVFGYDGIFSEQLKRGGHDLFADPGRGFLSRIGVRSVMNRSFQHCEASVTPEQARNLIELNRLWLVFPGAESPRLLASAELARRLEALGEDGGDEPIDLLHADGLLPKVDSIDSLANLAEASALIRSSGAEALLVIESTTYAEPAVVGVITRETILNYYGM